MASVCKLSEVFSKCILVIRWLLFFVAYKDSGSKITWIGKVNCTCSYYIELLSSFKLVADILSIIMFLLSVLFTACVLLCVQYVCADFLHLSNL